MTAIQSASHSRARAPVAPDPESRLTALILAGRRGPDDPLALATGAPHRALLDVRGTPLLQRVLDTLWRVPAIGRVVVSSDAPELLKRQTGLAGEIASGRLALIESESSPSRSVIRALRELSAEAGLFVTTADHALLSIPMVEHFLGAARATEADLAVGLVPRSALMARFPETRRTYLHLRGESYSGANLFAFRTAESLKAAEFWTRAEQFRKRPWRLVSVFGVRALFYFALRRLDLEAAFELVSRSIGVRVSPVVMPFAEAAVDVDKLSDLELVNQILSKREAPDPTA